MPSFKEYEKIEPISGAEGSRVRTNATDPSEELKRADFESAIEKVDVSKVERREVAQQPVQVQPTSDQPARESLMDLAKKDDARSAESSANPEQSEHTGSAATSTFAKGRVWGDKDTRSQDRLARHYSEKTFDPP